MSSQLNQILERVATIQTSIVCANYDGSPLPVTQSYAYLQWDIPTAVCPFWANDLKDWTSNIWAIGGAAAQRIQTTLPMHLCLMTKEQGASLKSNLQNLYANRDIVFDAFAASIQLNSGLGVLPFLLEATLTGGGVELPLIGSNEYLALRFDLQIVELFKVPVGM